MSSKKEKFLESAQKFIVKGQLDRAIRDYEQVVALDPNDIRHRQRLAELLVRANRNIEAIGEYEAIGKYYMDNGFYLKAIAVYKQVQKLDPDNIKTGINLASLNEKQGLTGNALTEYGKVCSYFEKNGKHNDALKILESMIALDPDNLNTRLKFAETRYLSGLNDKAYDDFYQIAFLLKKRGDESAFNQVSDRIRYLFPEKKEFASDLLASQIKGGDAAFAIPHLLEIVGNNQSDLNAWNLLLDAYRTTGARDEIKLALQKMVHIFPDDLAAREGLMQSALEEGDLEEGLHLLELHSAIFAEKGDYQTLERIYLGLLERAPHDVRILQGLKKLYETSGNLKKLAETTERLDSLSRVRARSHAESAGKEVPFSAELTAPVEGVVESLQEEEEEIPVHLAEEDSVGLVELEQIELEQIEPEQVEPEQTWAESAGAEDAEVEFEYPAEVELDLEIPDDELADLAKLYSETAAENQVSGSLAEEMGEQAVSDSEPSTGSGIPVHELFFAEEEEFSELDRDFLPGVEAEKADSTPSLDKYSPNGQFSAFKKGLDQQLDSGDTETRYNLGIAFMEMGLYDEAITEFQAAALDPRRRIDCMTLQGVCCRNKGDYTNAEVIFNKGIGQEGLSDEELLSIKYELALLYENAGRNEDALVMYRQIKAEQNDFRDVKEKIARLLGSEEFYDLDLVELENDDLE